MNTKCVSLPSVPKHTWALIFFFLVMMVFIETAQEHRHISLYNIEVAGEGWQVTHFSWMGRDTGVGVSGHSIMQNNPRVC